MIQATGKILSAALLLAFSTQAQAQANKELVVDLSKSVVAITTGFVGSDLLLFGTMEGEGDVIVVIRGPLRNQIVRRKERIAGIWVNSDEMLFDQVPDFYTLASNRPVDDFMVPETRDLHQIGAAYLRMPPRETNLSAGEVNDYHNALIRNKQRQGLYSRKQGDVIFLSNRLFRTQVHFPANVSVGTYGVDVHLVRNGEIASTVTTLLSVRKFGLEAAIFDFAHRHSMAYGILAILIAAVAGWLASVAFRKV
ncbi:MAG: TIGR02186 family protein [Rhodospirillales bacterium]